METEVASKNDKFADFSKTLQTYKGEKGALIPVLQFTQDTFGYIPEAATIHISEVLEIPVAEIYGVITFYAQFRLKPIGKYVIKTCNGTACHVNGSQRIGNAIQEELGVDYEETTKDGLFTFQSVACIGCCSLAPVIMINNETYGRLTPQKVKKILKEYKEGKN